MTIPNPHRAASRFDRQTMLFLEELARVYPNADMVTGKIAQLSASLLLPKPSIHVISDIHGEYKKLRHVVNNASGALRGLVERTFGDRLPEDQKIVLLNLIYYPRESSEIYRNKMSSIEFRKLLRASIKQQFEVLRELSRQRQISSIEEAFPSEFREVFRELLFAPQLERGEGYVDALIDSLLYEDSELNIVRRVARVVRNMLISELVVAGDLADRGPRADQVIEFLLRQPNVSITWGNHDAIWMAACLGHLPSIATVLRVSLRYRRLTQLEEGYGITLAALDKLARDVYGEDPVERFNCKGDGLRDSLLMARMQKAVAIMQFKLEGQLIDRNPQFDLEQRNLLHRIDPQAGTVTIDGRSYPLRDTNFPTIDWSDPYQLSPEEEICIERIRQSFLHSPVLWRHMRFVSGRGAMYLVRDNHLIFHACVPVDDQGEFLSLEVDGEQFAGRELFEKLSSVVQRVFRGEPEVVDLDMLWYLWAGARSPWFGKDKMATFETYFVEDPETHKETKNPYFKLIHRADFCEKILREFDVNAESGLIVNGHVPVKIEQGESPLKDSGKAVTIDGAFSEAYGDRGYTLVLDADRTYLAQHHHFDSVRDAITSGADIVPTVENLREFPQPRAVGETEQGESVAKHIEILSLLREAYRENYIQELV